MSSRLIAAGAGLALLILLAIGAAIGWWLAPRPVAEVVEARPEVRLPTGGVIAATAPPGSASAAALPPPVDPVPGGAVVQRRSRTVLQPRATAASACPPVTVDLQQYRQGDTVRVIASSPDATVLSSVDIPLQPQVLPPPAHKWALGLSYRSDRAPGAFIERDIGRLRIGAEVSRTPAGRADASVRVGITF